MESFFNLKWFPKMWRFSSLGILFLPSTLCCSQYKWPWWLAFYRGAVMNKTQVIPNRLQLLNHLSYRPLPYIFENGSSYPKIRLGLVVPAPLDSLHTLSEHMSYLGKYICGMNFHNPKYHCTALTANCMIVFERNDLPLLNCSMLLIKNVNEQTDNLTLILLDLTE